MSEETNNIVLENPMDFMSKFLPAMQHTNPTRIRESDSGFAYIVIRLDSRNFYHSLIKSSDIKNKVFLSQNHEEAIFIDSND